MKNEPMPEEMFGESDFVILEAGKSFRGIYEGYKIVKADKFGKEIPGREGKWTIEYAFKVNGKLKILTKSSARLWRAMENVSIGSEVIISKTGIGTDTRYTVDERVIP